MRISRLGLKPAPRSEKAEIGSAKYRGYLPSIGGDCTTETLNKCTGLKSARQCYKANFGHEPPPLPPHPCPRRPAAADSPHPTPVPTRLPPPQHPALAHIRRAWPGAHRVDHQRRVRMARRHTGPAATSTRARPAPGPAGQLYITREAGSSNALNRQCGTTGADTRAAFVDSASRHPRHPNTNSLLSNSNPLLSESQSTTIPLPSPPCPFLAPPGYVRSTYRGVPGVAGGAGVRSRCRRRSGSVLPLCQCRL